MAISAIGLNPKDTQKLFEAEFGTEQDFEELLRLGKSYAASYLDDQGVPLKPGVFEILEFLKDRGIKRAVATSSERAKAERYLTDSETLAFFDAVVCSDQFACGKPAPDIYLKACELIDLDPEQCLAIEDSYPGIESAYAAGISVVMIPDLLPPTPRTDELTLATLPDLLALKGSLY
jgi:HAD superfamily hydrolase (TIGR01509 family)